jgi:hypothetical protein
MEHYGGPVEQYTFTVTLSKGTLIIESRAMNLFGNYDPTPASDEITVLRGKKINTPFLQFLLSHPNVFPLLQKLIQRFGP